MRNRQHNGNAMSDAPRHHCGVFGIFGDERTYANVIALRAATVCPGGTDGAG